MAQLFTKAENTQFLIVHKAFIKFINVINYFDG